MWVCIWIWRMLNCFYLHEDLSQFIKNQYAWKLWTLLDCTKWSETTVLASSSLRNLCSDLLIVSQLGVLTDEWNTNVEALKKGVSVVSSFLLFCECLITFWSKCNFQALGTKLLQWRVWYWWLHKVKVVCVHGKKGVCASRDILVLVLSLGTRWESTSRSDGFTCREGAAVT